jgi:hypothetical protein
MFQQPHYPVVQFLLRWGNAVAIIIALIPLVVAVISSAVGAPFWVVIPAGLVAAILWLFVKSYIEVLAIIADTLLPK